MKRHMVLILVALMLLNGCAAMARPTVYPYPQRGQTATQQAQDRADCEAWAKNETAFDPGTDVAKNVGLGVLIWGLVGAAAGAAAGAAVGRPDIGAAFMGPIFALFGGAVGGTSGFKEDKDRFNRAHAACMATRSPIATACGDAMAV